MPMSTVTRTSPPGTRRPVHGDASSPTWRANTRRNLQGGGWSRQRRWRAAREAAWSLLAEHVPPGGSVVVIGAGNGDDLPLRRLARRAARLDLIDLDARALQRARRRCAFTRADVRSIVEDVTGGAADSVIARARETAARPVAPPSKPIGLEDYDVVISDLLATQLLYPALADTGPDAATIDTTLLTAGQPLTDAVIARLHAAAPTGIVIHLHDLLGWWPNHPQPFTLETVLSLAASDPAAALTLANRGNTPLGCDPRAASNRLGAEILDTRFRRWPFTPGTDYLVCATVARTKRPVATIP